jgi:hypothetical protein
MAQIDVPLHQDGKNGLGTAARKLAQHDQIVIRHLIRISPRMGKGNRKFSIPSVPPPAQSPSFAPIVAIAREFHAVCVKFAHPSSNYFTKTEEIRMAPLLLKKSR